jgi:enoyl-CoA hydratase/carnithine racemase
MAHWTLPHIAGVAAAAEVLLTGRTFDGTEAVALGLASRALPADEVLEYAMRIAADIAVNVSPNSAALSKRLLWESVTKGYSARQVASLETVLHHRVMGTLDAQEGVAAFLERRAPRWSASVSRDWTPLPET